jgi:hypothetical protein
MTCRTPAEFCADWAKEQEPPAREPDPAWLIEVFGQWKEPKPVLGELALLKALRHFAGVRPEPSIADFERVVEERGRGLHAPPEASAEDVGWGTSAAGHLLSRWREYRRICQARQRERAWPGWAVYGYRYRGVCREDAQDLVGFSRALIGFEWAYSLPADIARDAWLETLRFVVSGERERRSGSSADASDDNSPAMQHLLASWEAYRAAWETHACRSDDCQPSPDAAPYSAADAFWEDLRRISRLIGHRVQFNVGGRSAP